MAMRLSGLVPRYSIGRLAADLAIPAQLNAIRESFRTWANVQGMALPLDEVAENGAITVDFLDRWPAEFGRYAAGHRDQSTFWADHPSGHFHERAKFHLDHDTEWRWLGRPRCDDA